MRSYLTVINILSSIQRKEESNNEKELKVREHKIKNLNKQKNKDRK